MSSPPRNKFLEFLSGIDYLKVGGVLGLAYIGIGVHRIAKRLDDGREFALAQPTKLRLKTRRAKDQFGVILHEVDYGESLYRIARRRGIGVNRLAQANGHQDASSMVLRPGQVLRIPEVQL